MSGSTPHRTSGLRALAAIGLLMSLNGCALAFLAGGSSVGAASSALYAATHVDEIKRTAAAIAKTTKDITPEQEYYIGRSVAAAVLHQYPPYANEQANHYLNLVGQSIVQVSDRPETYAGYHFLILDSHEVNAFAAPGGFILVTRGLLRLCKDEDEVAAILAHEVVHVQERHAMKSIREDRVMTAIRMVASEAMKVSVQAESTFLARVLEGSVGDIIKTLTQRGYSREMEHEADDKAIGLMRRVGYDPIALANILRQIGDQETATSPIAFFKTHPGAKDRVEEIEARVGGTSFMAVPPERKKRFSTFLSEV